MIVYNVHGGRSPPKVVFVDFETTRSIVEFLLLLPTTPHQHSLNLVGIRPRICPIQDDIGILDWKTKRLRKVVTSETLILLSVTTAMV